MDRTEVVVVGAGLVGAAVAHVLMTDGVRVVVLEAASEPAAGASRSNSGIVHTGFDSIPDAFETAMILEQGRRWRTVFDALRIAYRVPGALMLARNDDEATRLAAIAENASRNGVVVELLDRSQVPRERHGALLVPGEAITDPYEVVCRLLADGPELRLNWPVRTVEPEHGGAVVSGPRGVIACDFVVNCAGLYADAIASDGSFTITPRRGEFVVYARGTADLLEHMLLPLPSERGKGVLVFPTLYGHLCAGPSAVDQLDKEDWRPRRVEIEAIAAKAATMLPALRDLRPVSAWAGLRPAGTPHNYIVEWSARVPSLLHLAGIRSTGLSSCLGLAEHARGLLRERGLVDGRRRRRPDRRLMEATAPRPWWERLNAMRGVTGPC